MLEKITNQQMALNIVEIDCYNQRCQSWRFHKTHQVHILLILQAPRSRQSFWGWDGGVHIRVNSPIPFMGETAFLVMSAILKDWEN